MLAICRNKKMDFSKLRKSTLCDLPTLGTLERAVGTLRDLGNAATLTEGLGAALQTTEKAANAGEDAVLPRSRNSFQTALSLSQGRYMF